MYPPEKIEPIIDDEVCPLSYDYDRLERMIIRQMHHVSNGLKSANLLKIPPEVSQEEKLTYLSTYFDAIVAPYLELQDAVPGDDAETLHNKEVARLRGAYLLRYLEGENMQVLTQEAKAAKVPGMYLHDSLKELVKEATRSFASQQR